jgi:hypothetical protein
MAEFLSQGAPPAPPAPLPHAAPAPPAPLPADFAELAPPARAELARAAALEPRLGDVLARILLAPAPPAAVDAVAALLARLLAPKLLETAASAAFEPVLWSLAWALGEEALDSPLNRAALALRAFGVLLLDGPRLEASKVFRASTARKAALALADAHFAAVGGTGAGAPRALEVVAVLSPGRTGSGGAARARGGGGGAAPAAAAAGGSAGRGAPPAPAAALGRTAAAAARWRALEVSAKPPEVALLPALSAASR